MPDFKPAIDPIQAVLPLIAGEPAIARAIVFGSRAWGDFQPRSDLDLALSCPQIDRGDWSNLTDRLEEAPTLIKLDLHWLEDLSPKFRSAILQEGRSIYERP